MDKKVLYFDVETTGRNWHLNDITQLGVIIEVNGEIVDERDIRCQPFNWDNIEDEALQVTGVTKEQLAEFQEPHEAYKEFIELLGKYVDKFDREDKFYPAGYNVEFDLNFLSSFFRKNKDVYLGSWINWRKLDPLPLLFAMEYKGEIKLENYKLETVANHFGIELQAHDAFSDILATRKILHRILNDSDSTSDVEPIITEG